MLKRAKLSANSLSALCNRRTDISWFISFAHKFNAMSNCLRPKQATGRARRQWAFSVAPLKRACLSLSVCSTWIADTQAYRHVNKPSSVHVQLAAKQARLCVVVPVCWNILSLSLALGGWVCAAHQRTVLCELSQQQTKLYLRTINIHQGNCPQVTTTTTQFQFTTNSLHHPNYSTHIKKHEKPTSVI